MQLKLASPLNSASANAVKDDSDPRLEELIGIICLWDSVYFLSIVSKTMAEELIRVRR